MQRKLTAGGAAAPGVTYTTVMTRLDELVTPWASGFMQNAGATNNVLQDICPGDASEHVLVAVDPVAAQLTFNALDPAHARPIDCNGLPPVRNSAAGTSAAQAPRTRPHHRRQEHRQHRRKAVRSR
jgi:hypothetical protein